MRRINREGGLPHILNKFLYHTIPGETNPTQVWECTTDEIVKKAKDEKLEVQVIIDRKNNRAYIVAIGFSFSRLLLPPFMEAAPSLYFSELSEAERITYAAELDKARKQLMEKRRLEDLARAVKREQKAQETLNGKD